MKITEQDKRDIEQTTTLLRGISEYLCMIWDRELKFDDNGKPNYEGLDEQDREIATGIAEEVKGSTFINKTSYVENCETSAWGRALANMGIGLDTSVASAEEVQNAIANQNSKPKGAYTLKIGDDNWDKVLNFVVNNKQKGLSWIIQQLETKYTITKEVESQLKTHAS